MSVLQQVQEGSTSWLTVAFSDKDGDPVSPSAVEYRIDSGSTQITDWTAVSAASSVEIEIAAAENALLSQSGELEERTVTVKATFSGGGVAYDAYRYLIRNLIGVA